ncbi:MAG: tail fiber domain-containing protein, partial [Anaerolineales bacterium]
SNPATPENIGHIATVGIAESVVVADGYAYMAEHGDLRAYDVRDPANPVEVASFGTTFCLDVAVAGNYVYLANGFDGLYVFDVTVARATSFSGHFLGDGGGLTNLQLNSLQAADGNPAQAVYVDNVGNVGIGTTAPEDLLHVYGGTGGPAHIRARMILEDDDTAYLQFVTPSTTEKGLLFGDEANGDRAGLIFNNASTPQGLQFRTGNNTTRMVLTSAGDVGIGTTDPTNKLDVVGDVSATTFITTSDRSMKENLRPVVPEAVLAKVAALPIHQWNFKTDADTTHLGPMAQDFYAAFQVGPDDKHIATVDADGVALAAIQGLNAKLERENAGLKARLEKLEQLLNHKLNGGAR